MILAVDVSYRSREAVVGGILFRNWLDEKPVQEFIIPCLIQAGYRPGQFYLRELPCITAMLEHVGQPVDCIIIDGFVFLGKDKKPGLGKRLRDSVNNRVIVIGVAKSPYRDTPKSAEVLRGRSRRPLYVTADGISEKQAKLLIKNMHGKNRIPTLLKYVDRLCANAVERQADSRR